MEEKKKTDLQAPYPEQSQEEPGLQSKMIPVPDDGSQTYIGSNRLKGQKAIITGGDSGIGRSVALAYAHEGSDIVLNYLPQEESDAQEVKQLVEAVGQKIKLIPGDLREENFSKELIEGAVKFFGDPTTLVLVAGKQQTEVDIRNLSTEQMVDTYKTNVFSLIWLVKAALPYLHESSNIITANYIQADQPSSFLVDYAKTKAAIKNMTNSLTKQLAPEGIRVNSVVAPGLIWTPLQAVRGQPKKNIPSFVRLLYSSAPDNFQNWQEPTFFLHQMTQPIQQASQSMLMAEKDKCDIKF